MSDNLPTPSALPAADHYDPSQAITAEGSGSYALDTLTADDVPKNPFIFISSPRRAGKSELVLHLLREFHGLNRFTHYCLVSQTLSGYEGYIPFTYQFETMDHVPAIISKCQDVAEYNAGVKEREHYISCSMLVILDDVIGDPSDIRRVGNAIQKLAVNGRHIFRDDPNEENEFGVILISQKISAIPPVIRQNADIVCSARLASRVERETFIEQFLTLTSGRDGLREARMVFDAITLQPFTFICVMAYKSIRTSHKSYVRQLKAEIDKPKIRLFGTEKDWRAKKLRVQF